MPRKKKTTKGKQKIEIRRIKNEEVRQICFSKRRSGLFTKASDLSTLCGSDIAVLVFSPGGKPYSFGSPDINPVIDRFLSDFSSSSWSGFCSGKPSNMVEQLSQRCLELTNQLEAWKAKGAMLEEKLNSPSHVLEYECFENMDDLDELGQLAEALKQVKLNADAQVNRLLTNTGASFSTPVIIHNQREGASSSHAVMANNQGIGASSSLNMGASASFADFVAEMMAFPPSPPCGDIGFRSGFF
ncbi:agamous-like MADS-box protein AGL29 [Phoenix dactylifera]|uniref:Agamous-like MADS-box protein AGL29 n=1 Tax=Phoenix dactylifera TaxID=42345 RepID=A0A8B7BXE5_PHODC|nr:agamous-like MADS-box protein AGL29 [Phoenix dactylifera]